MLQFCLRQFVVITAVMVLSTQVSAVLFQAPLAVAEDFQKYALLKNQQTYTQWIYASFLNNGTEAHPQVLEFSQQALREGSSKQVLSDWNLIRQSIELNQADREVFTLLAEKLQQQKELCRYVLLDSEVIKNLEFKDIVANCQRQATALPPSLHEQLEPRDLLLVDGKVFTKNQLPQKIMAGNYHWKIISDRYEDRHFTGTAADFTKQKFELQNWVSGDCKDYKLNHKDFATLLQSQIYFSDICVNPGILPEQTFSSWASEHKTLLWGASILAASLAALQLKDKTLIITRP